MNEPLEESYLIWLYSQVADPEIKNPKLTHWRLIRILFKREFAWIVPNDDNRIQDGKNIRWEFVQDKGYEDVDPNWLELGCSFLELMVGLSRRLEFEAGGEAHYWFWDLVSNIRLSRCNDSSRMSETQIQGILDKVVWRQYEPDGRGGFFPLREPDRDQRGVELWYQLSAYVLEQN